MLADIQKVTEMAEKVADKLEIVGKDLVVELWCGIYLAERIAESINTQLSSLIAGSFSSGHKGIRDYCRDLVEHIKCRL